MVAAHAPSDRAFASPVDPGARRAQEAGVKEFFPHSATTRDITVRVSVTYLQEQSEPAKGRWFWAYHIRIENGGGKAVLAHFHCRVEGL